MAKSEFPGAQPPTSSARRGHARGRLVVLLGMLLGAVALGLLGRWVLDAPRGAAGAQGVALDAKESERSAGPPAPSAVPTTMEHDSSPVIESVAPPLTPGSNRVTHAIQLLLECPSPEELDSLAGQLQEFDVEDRAKVVQGLAASPHVPACAVAWLRTSMDPSVISQLDDALLGRVIDLSGCDYASILAGASELSTEERTEMLVRCLSQSPCFPDPQTADALFRDVMAGASRPEHLLSLIDHLSSLGWDELLEPTGLDRLAFLPVTCSWNPALWTAAADRLQAVPTCRAQARQFMVLMLAVAARQGEAGAEECLRGFVDEALRRPQWEFNGHHIDEALLGSTMRTKPTDGDAVALAFGAWSDASLALSRVGDALGHDPASVEKIIELTRHPSRQMRELCLRWLVGRRGNDRCPACGEFVTGVAIFDPELGPVVVEAIGRGEAGELAEITFAAAERDPRLPAGVREAIARWRTEGPFR